MKERRSHPRWMASVLWAAAIYNVAWGAFAVAFPRAYFEWAGLQPPAYPQLWQCIGMIVGVYGLGYALAARDPYRHWPIVAVGLLGKLLGPIGFLWSIVSGQLPWTFGATLITNDVIWWVPFAGILYASFRHATRPRSNGSPIRSPRQAMAVAQTSAGPSLLELTEKMPQLVVFLRHFGCTFCREALEEIRRLRPHIEERGTSVVLVHMGTPLEAEEAFRAHGMQHVVHVSDPTCQLYRSFGLRRGKFGQLFGWHVWRRGLVAGLVRRHGLGRLLGDGFQMPGVFLVHHGFVLRGFRHESAADTPDYMALARCPEPARRT